MATYIIGDVHGCLHTLESLVSQLRASEFASEEELRFALVGDLVNRGLHSLACLRWVFERQAVCETVLGNHDLHLLSCYFGLRPVSSVGIQQILAAADCAELMQWLLQRPLILPVEDQHVVVHAGLHPRWAVDDALEHGVEATTLLQKNPKRALKALQQDSRQDWCVQLDPESRAIEALRIFTQTRVCTASGEQFYSFKGELSQCPPEAAAWFQQRKSHVDPPLVFGHWAALGCYQEGVYHGLDSGCAWGGALTAMRTSDGTITQVSTDQQDL